MAPHDEDMRIIALDLLPTNLSYEFISPLRKVETWAALRERIEVEVEYYKQGANRLHTGKGVMLAEHDGARGGEGAEHDDDDLDPEELLAILKEKDPEASAAEILALMKKKRFFNRKGGRGGAGAGRGRPALRR